MRKIDAYRQYTPKVVVDGKLYNEVKQFGLPSNPKKIIPKGCQEFDINGHKIIALSYKRALIKYEKLIK